MIEYCYEGGSDGGGPATPNPRPLSSLHDINSIRYPDSIYNEDYFRNLWHESQWTLRSHEFEENVLHGME